MSTSIQIGGFTIHLTESGAVRVQSEPLPLELPINVVGRHGRLLTVEIALPFEAVKPAQVEEGR